MRAGFWAVAAFFAATTAFSSVPTPLYVVYQQRDGFSTSMLTVIFAGYSVGVVVSLAVGGHISDRLGRRRTLAATLATSLLSVVLFLVADGPLALMAARLISGFSTGIASPAASAYLAELDAAGRDPSPHRVQAVITASTLGGIAVGPLASGALADATGRPLSAPYLAFGGLLLAGAGFLMVAPETVARPSHGRRHRPRRLTMPGGHLPAYAAAACASAAAFAALGAFTALAPTFLLRSFARESHVLGGVVVFGVMAAAAAVQSAMRAHGPRATLACGMAALPLGLALVVVAVWLPTANLPLFLVGGIVTGAGGGLVVNGCVGVVTAVAPRERLAETLAGLYVVTYAGAVIPVVGLGVATETMGVRWSLLAFFVVGALAIGLAGRSLFSDPEEPADGQATWPGEPL
jgi:MFS family permease